jgi:glycosyltransferase involved in cell wall biosynthesis
VDNIIVHSAYIQQKLQKEFNVPDKRICIIPHGNFDFYVPQNLITSGEARFHLNILSSEDVILFFGFIREYKGLDLLLDSFSKASFSNSSLRLIIAGEPGNKTLYEKYEKLINNSEAKEKITYNFSYIPMEQIQLYFRAADFVVLPYKNIDHSGIIHLAYSFAKPIIATKVGDFPETIEEGKSGYLVEKNNSDALAKCILNAFNNRNKISQMGKFANELSVTKYSWKDIAKKTIALYKN